MSDILTRVFGPEQTSDYYPPLAQLAEEHECGDWRQVSCWGLTIQVCGRCNTRRPPEET